VLALESLEPCFERLEAVGLLVLVPGLPELGSKQGLELLEVVGLLVPVLEFAELDLDLEVFLVLVVL
jgi:hypothetical protein